ncbi:Intradiol ring-cleavage dioxygenase [Fusarium solani]|uniref:Intradiol ring-cleavage dioxygenase n=1 Tax=Fusarium solani TaxID=169388 RepID=A0A9P9HAI7_FUSSL|nr:Intradiol ring-cleavage dioxygenase [Fusarium solani]KAH7253313.1 Intradiol ring-cleavage dioxygenase [Fusarium solani]
MADLTTDSIPNAVAISTPLITHAPDFARETRLSTEEWKAGLGFLVQVSHPLTRDATNTAQESILLSDVLGLSLLGSVLGPFHTHDAPEVPHGDPIPSDDKEQPLFYLCTVKDCQEDPIESVKHSDRLEPAGRAILSTNSDGKLQSKVIIPVSYPIPSGGPVGKLLTRLHRHYWRPAHMHFLFVKDGWYDLITALCIDPDPYLTSDAVFGVKSSLIVKLQKISEELANHYNIPQGMELLTYDFVLITSDESARPRDKKALGNIFPCRECALVNHLPVPDLNSTKRENLDSQNTSNTVIYGFQEP